MVQPQEALIKRICSSASEEDSWWWLFKLLIPGMAGRDLPALRMEYSPCGFLSAQPSLLFSNTMCLCVRSPSLITDFIHLDMAFMIPAITFPDAIFHSAQPNPSDPSSPWVMGMMSQTST